MKRILAAIDFSDVTDRVVEHAAAVADAFSASLVVIHVAAPDPDFVGYEAGPETVREVRAVELRAEHRSLQGLAERLRERGLDATALLVQGPTVETILDEARRRDADLVVIGSHGRGALFRALLGSVSEGVIRRARRPVVVIPARGSEDTPD